MNTTTPKSAMKKVILVPLMLIASLTVSSD